MTTVTILDTSICTKNLGDNIIMDAVSNILEDIFDGSRFVHIPTHEVISKRSYELMKTSEFKIIGGSNLLASNMNVRKQWKVGLWDSLFVEDIILLGVGWWQYQKQANLYSKILYRRLFSRKYFHSVRDSYSEQQLKSIGINNVINTSCPTVWSLTEKHCSEIPSEKSDSVLVTFTQYNQNEQFDSQVVDLLKIKYDKIYFWIQQSKDYPYMQKICGNTAVYLKPTLKALDEFLSNHDVDYVGTRLHCGIRALQHKKRALILAVDNRATEIAKDTNIPVVKREDIEAIKNWIDKPYEAKIKIPQENISKWKSQFVK